MIDLELAGKTAIIVGGSSNIGRAAALAFAREDANVVIAARHRDDCERVAALADDLGSGGVLVVPGDATKYEDVEALAQATLDEFDEIDIFVGSIGWDAPGDFLDVDRSEWDSVIATNYVYTLNCFHVLLPIMVRQGHGTLITISSAMGRHSHPVEPVYCGTKAAQIAFSHAMARQYGPLGIRINVVAPGNTPPTSPDVVGGNNLHRPKTHITAEQLAKLRPMGEGILAATPLGKAATADDVAASILFVASEVTAGHMTGQVIGVDGGLYMPH
jgi:NAD(P)-dependent dehydrogenase (short-subunit alcohol dehydrogenase family)